jgi:hypothetical protein
MKTCRTAITLDRPSPGASRGRVMEGVMDKCPLCNEVNGHLIGCKWPNMVERGLHLTKGTVALCKQIANLQDENATQAQRLVEAEGLLNKIVNNFSRDYAYSQLWYDVHEEIKAFLTPTALKEPDSCCGGLILSDGDIWECDKCGRTWPRVEVIAPSEHVLVRRDDLIWVLEHLSQYAPQIPGRFEEYDHLKATLEGGKP